MTPREQYPVFIFEKFQVEQQGTDLLIHSYFRANPDLHFHSVDTFKNIGKTIDKTSLDIFAFHIGLAQMFSYWKATCSPVIRIEAGKLTDEQVIWWHNLLIKGMGEYFYKNQIDFTPANFVTIEPASNKEFILPHQPLPEHYLVPIGGGKDSAVTLELFRQHNLPMVGLMVNPTPAMTQLAGLANISNMIEVERQLDPKIFALNQQGFYNGHVPFSASIAFISVLAGYLSDCSFIAVSNERSANEYTTMYRGYEINHQYSKSYEFEKTFRDYVQTYVSPDIHYFSFSRPLSEIQIAKLFSQMPKYFPVIRSCNRGQKTNSWCCSCPKCLSTFILLYPFVGKEIKKIFPENLFKNKTLFPVLQALIDSDFVRPFECVGTREELIMALYLTIEQFKGKPLPILLTKAVEQYLAHEKNLALRAETLLLSWDDHHFLPSALEKLVRNVL